MRNLIVGLGKSGLAAAALLRKKQQEVVGYDEQKKGAPFPTMSTISFEGIDRIILSPGVDPRRPFLDSARALGIPIIGETELGLQEVGGTVIGITGTNGKTTTSLLLAHFLRQNGKTAEVLGNIGKPLCQYLVHKGEQKGSDRVIILELSSFQLETAETKALFCAAITNVSPNHLDRYDSYAEYQNAKWRIRSLLLHEEHFVVGSSLSELFPRAIDGGSSSASIARAIAKLLGCEATSLEGFQTPEHRLEYLSTWRGISFYNDSKSTSPASTIYAVQKIQKPILLICGGSEKNLDYTLWKTAFKGMVKTVITIGPCGKKMARAVKRDYLTYEKSSLKEAFFFALSLAKSGEAILLSPGSASFDAFKNFEERGTHFKELVRHL